ncbi:MAG: hypothetical protein E2P02_18425 [Acidobacteria bacterium]|nr:MAG: hypothetical protein E2P02_18425 [Acidobacteriota bacterium]
MKSTTPMILLLAALGTATAETVFLNDGGALEVSSYEVRGDVVVFVTPDGKLRSLPRAYVDLDATQGRFSLSETSRLPTSEAMVAEAVELVGLRRLTDEIATSAQGVARGVRHASFPPEVLALATSQGFRADRLYEVAEKAFRSRASRLELSAALVWLRSQLARRKRVSEADKSRDTRESFEAATMKNPPSRARLELVQRLDTASGTSEAAVEIQAAMMGALLEGLETPASAAATVVEQARPQFAAKTRGRIQMSLLYTYKDVSDEELAENLRYLESENGRWLSRVVLKSLCAAMEDAARRTGATIARELRERQKVRA